MDFSKYKGKDYAKVVYGGTYFDLDVFLNALNLYSFENKIKILDLGEIKNHNLEMTVIYETDNSEKTKDDFEQLFSCFPDISGFCFNTI